MNNNTFFVIEEKHNKNGKVFSHAEKVNNCYNLVSYFKPCKDFTIISINAVSTYKEARKIADFWNEGAKAHNNYYFAP